MAVNASPEIIRDMKKTISKTVNEINGISEGIERYINVQQSTWNDEQATRYRDLMIRVAKLTSSPSEELTRVLPQLDRLAEALDGYNSVRFE